MYDIYMLHKDINRNTAELIGHWMDITSRKKMENELSESKEKIVKSYDKLQRILEETTQALASALEKRDPYTAGHQERVTKLACAIAKELGVNNDQIEAIRIAGLLHDIGKIYIPSEILSRPGVLSKIEFELVKTHCITGFDILKPIEFPWPIAEIVLQHHERINGSGYPNNLSDNQFY